MWIAAPHKHLDCRYTFFWILRSEDNDKVVSNQTHARSVISERFCLGWATGVIRRGHTDANWACGERRSASSRAQLEHIAVTKKRKTVRIDARTPPLLLFGRGAVHEGGCKGADWLVGRPCNCLAPRPCRFPKEHGGQFSHLSPPPTSAQSARASPQHRPSPHCRPQLRASLQLSPRARCPPIGPENHCQRALRRV